MFSERYELRLWILFSRNSNFKAGSRLWFGVDTGQMYVIFAMDKVPRGQVFLRWLRIFPISIIPPVIRTYSFIPLACAECDDSLPFSAASSIPLCYVLFPVTLLHYSFILSHLILPSISWSTSRSCCSQIHIQYSFGNSIFFFIGAHCGVVVKALRYKPVGRGSDSRWCHWNFSVAYFFRPHYGPGVDSTSNRNEYQVYCLGVKAAGALGCEPYHHPVPLLWNLGTLTSWKPLGHSRPVHRTALTYCSLSEVLYPWELEAGSRCWPSGVLLKDPLGHLRNKF